MLTLKHRERGDTIIEVLIAIAIVSLVLVAAYVISNKNSQAIQATEERIQAQHLVESQIEALRVGNGISSPNTCFVGTTPNPPANCTNFTQAGSGATYTVAITQVTVSGVTTYTIKANWTALNSVATGDNNVTMFYRVQ